MLKSYPNAKNCTKYINRKCGEVVCQTESCFLIVCTFCEMKLFEFDDFVLHVKNIHISALKQESYLEALVKEEGVSECTEDSADAKLLNENPTHNSANFEDTVEPTVNGLPATIFVESRNLNLESKEDLRSDDWDSMSEEDDEFSHKRTNRNKEHACQHCRKRFSTLRQLKNHMKLQHLKPKSFECEKCEEKFSENRSLQSHVRKVHTGYSCPHPQCDKIYKSSDALKVHSYTHKQVKDFICDFENCSKAFVSRKRLTIHKRVHTGLRNYICEICGYRTRVKDSLKIHMRTHTGEKPYVCQICSKCFVSSSMLNEHKAVHSKERPYKCDVCEAAFSARKALYHHKHLHSGIKKFKCKICGNAYAQAAGLSGHMRSHKKEKLF